MIVSRDEEKKIAKKYFIKILRKWGIKGTFSSLIKNICDKTTANVIFNDEILGGESKPVNTTRQKE